MNRKHTVRSYDEELDLLKAKISEMGRLTALQMGKAIEVLKTRNSDLAQEMIKKDKDINRIQDEVDGLCVEILAKRQPMAFDLRVVVAGQKMAADIERTGDYAANIAKFTMELNHTELQEPIRSITQMTEIGKQMLNGVIDAYEENDADKAIDIWHEDCEIDQIYADVLTTLREIMAAESAKVKSCSILLFVARCCERIGDHITNLAERVHYIGTGELYNGKPGTPGACA